MSKRQLYFLVVVLVILLGGVLFWPTDPYGEANTNKDNEAEIVTETVTEPNVDEAEEVSEPEVAPEDFPEQVVIDGVFLSLVDGENQYQKKFKYMLIDDGSEVMRVDLRPLIGYSDIDVIEKLGVNRGEQVRVIGDLVEGVFKIISVTKQ